MIFPASITANASTWVSLRSMTRSCARHLGFPDGFFDAVVAQYVITAVPDPEATLDEFVRVTRPGGEIILVNHLGVRLLERKAMPPLGLFSLIRFERLGKGATNGPGR
jgi:phosphatidylethanolamine/phosphatidyl-N-methylethanolamine N-methyltransferase